MKSTTLVIWNRKSCSAIHSRSCQQCEWNLTSYDDDRTFSETIQFSNGITSIYRCSRYFSGIVRYFGRYQQSEIGAQIGSHTQRSSRCSRLSISPLKAKIQGSNGASLMNQRLNRTSDYVHF